MGTNPIIEVATQLERIALSDGNSLFRSSGDVQTHQQYLPL